MHLAMRLLANWYSLKSCCIGLELCNIACWVGNLVVLGVVEVLLGRCRVVPYTNFAALLLIASFSAEWIPSTCSTIGRELSSGSDWGETCEML